MCSASCLQARDELQILVGAVALPYNIQCTLVRQSGHDLFVDMTLNMTLDTAVTELDGPKGRTATEAEDNGGVGHTGPET